jgi:hypothetical protein
MGREARRRRLAGPIATEGDLQRAIQAGEIALFQLYRDQRLRDRYLAWCEGRALVPLSRMRVADTLDEDRRWAVMERVLTAICRPATPDEWAAVAGTLEPMRVPCWRWATSMFVKTVFPCQAYNDLNPSRPQLLRIQRAGLVHLPRGHVPHEKGSAILRRHGDWWYRRDIRVPPMTELELAREDAGAAGVFRGDPKTGEISRAKVYDGIDNFKNLLKQLKDDNEEA